MRNYEKQYMKIHKEVGLPEILTAVAEEASEVAQAALKLRRTLNHEYGNSTPVDFQKAVESFQEELGDFACCVNAAAVDPRIDMSKVYRTEKHKRLRWLSRIYEERRAQEEICKNPAVYFTTKEHPGVIFTPANMVISEEGDLI